MLIKINNMRTLQNTTTVQHQKAYSGQKVRAEVVLGSPSANCGGVGICRVMAYGEDADISCPRVASWLSITKEGKIRFEFEKDSMEGRFMRRHFRWFLFQVFETYVVPRSILGPLKLEQRAIRPGIYTVMEVDNRLIVEF